MKNVIYLILLIFTVSIAGCRPKAPHYDADMQFVVDQGHAYAHRFLNIDPKRQVMKRYDFLLDVKTREQQLASEIGPEYAEAFIKAFNDSVHIKEQ